MFLDSNIQINLTQKNNFVQRQVRVVSKQLVLMR